MRRPALPQLFLGLVAIAAAIGVAAHFAADAVRDAHPTGETVTVTGSAKRPITSNLVKWSVDVDGNGTTTALAASRLRIDLATVRGFLVRGGLPRSAISLSGVSTDVIVERI